MSTLHKAWDQWELQQHTFGFLDFFLLRPDQYICRCSNTCTCQENCLLQFNYFLSRESLCSSKCCQESRTLKKDSGAALDKLCGCIHESIFQQWRSFCVTNALACIELQLGCSPLFSFFCTGCYIHFKEVQIFWGTWIESIISSSTRVDILVCNPIIRTCNAQQCGEILSSINTPVFCVSLFTKSGTPVYVSVWWLLQ